MASNTTTLPQLPAGAVSTNALATSDIRDIKPPLPTRDWTWLWGVLGAVLLGAVLAWWWRRRRRLGGTAPVIEVDPRTLVPPHVRARQRLEEALALIGTPRPFCFALTDALRWYLEEQMNLRAPERTTEEFLEEISGSPLLDTAQHGLLADFLTRCDLVKFARHHPGEPELRELHASALRLVAQTEPSQRAAMVAAPPAPQVPNAAA